MPDLSSNHIDASVIEEAHKTAKAPGLKAVFSQKSTHKFKQPKKRLLLIEYDLSCAWQRWKRRLTKVFKKWRRYKSENLSLYSMVIIHSPSTFTGRLPWNRAFKARTTTTAKKTPFQISTLRHRVLPRSRLCTTSQRQCLISKSRKRWSYWSSRLVARELDTFNAKSFSCLSKPVFSLVTWEIWLHTVEVFLNLDWHERFWSKDRE